MGPSAEGADRRTRRDGAGEERDWQGRGGMISRDRVVLGGMPSWEEGRGGTALVPLCAHRRQAAAVASFSSSLLVSLSTPCPQLLGDASVLGMGWRAGGGAAGTRTKGRALGPCFSKCGCPVHPPQNPLAPAFLNPTSDLPGRVAPGNSPCGWVLRGEISVQSCSQVILRHSKVEELS